MSSVLRSMQFLVMTLWVGGIAFFAFVLAPVAFHNLPGHEAGLIVRASILILHRIGLVCGAIFLASTVLLRSRLKRSSFAAEATLAAVMFALTLFSQSRILPAMEKDRLAATAPIDDLAKDDPNRANFDRLHILSERVEGAVLLLGIAVVVLLAVDRPRLVTER